MLLNWFRQGAVSARNARSNRPRRHSLRTGSVLELLENRTLLAATLFVDTNNHTGVANGSATKPFTTIQAAVAAAQADDVIKVARGTYSENVVIPDTTLQLQGGFVGGTESAYATGKAGDFAVATPATNVTRIVGASDEPTLYVRFQTNTTVGIDGFNISGGLHGIYVQPNSGENEVATVLITHNVIENNGPAALQSSGGDFAFNGGGIYTVNAKVTISNNVIRNNNANRGGGLYVASEVDYTVTDNLIANNTGYDDHGGGVVLVPLPVAAVGTGAFSRNVISGNVASKAYTYGWGGGMLVPGEPNNPTAYKPVILSNNVWNGNSAPSVGGALFVDDGAKAMLDHELMYGNFTTSPVSSGGAIFLEGSGGGDENMGNDVGSMMTITNSTFANNYNNNTESQRGNGVFVDEFSKLTVSNSIFWDNVDDLDVDETSTLTVTYSDVQETWPGTGNISVDPLFANAAAGDYHLKSPNGRFDPTARGGAGGFVFDSVRSPAIDAGDPVSPFANETAPNGGRINLGFEGNTPQASRSSFNLASLGTAGTTIFGVDGSDESGRSVSNAGDVNGDGFDDLIIGARYGDGADNSKTSAGESYIVFGSASPQATINLANLGSAGITIFGADTGDQLGTSVSGAGDVNGDGFDDLIVGAFGGDAAGNSRSGTGESCVVFGGTSLPMTINVATPGAVSITIFGVDGGDQSGSSVSGAGDVNGDGFDDLLIGATSGDGASNTVFGAGETYIVFGGASLPTMIDLANLGSTGVRIFGVDNVDISAKSVANAGDVNGDGFDDIIIGAYQAAAAGNAKPFAGESYLIFGGPSLPTTINLANLGSAGITIFGADADDRSGISVSTAGDVNADGFDDLLIGASGARIPGNSVDIVSAGKSYLIFGAMAMPSTIDLASLGSAGVTILGAPMPAFSGCSVSAAGDFNADGFDDLLIGAFASNARGALGPVTGQGYLVFGSASLPATISLANLGSSGLEILGVDERDYSGTSVSNAGDVNGDGFDDLLVGAPKADGAGNVTADSGESYLIFGGDYKSSVTHLGTVAAEVLTGNASANVMVGGRANDTLIGNGGADVLVGGEGSDTLAISNLAFRRIAGGNGLDMLRLDGAGLSLNLTTLADNKLTDIEVINITGSGNNSLTLNVHEVLEISSTSNTLLVRRNAGDTVNIGSGWTQLANQTFGSTTYNYYSQGAARLGVEKTDNTAPTADIVDISPDPRINSAGIVTVTFNEPVTGVDLSDFQLTRDSKSLSLNGITLNGSGASYTLDLSSVTALPGNYALTLKASNSGIRDAALNAFTADASDAWATTGVSINLTTNQKLVVQAASGNLQVLINDVVDTTYSSIPAATLQGITITGGTGNNLIDLSGVTPTAFSRAGGVTVSVQGGAGNDSLLGSAFADQLNGGEGNDLLSGGVGNDSLNGGAGVDGFRDVAYTDFVQGQIRDISLTNTSFLVKVGAGTLSADSLQEFEFADITGGLMRDRINAGGFTNSAVTTISGGGGNDVITGTAGADMIMSLTGADLLNGGGGSDTVFAGSGNDTISGGDGADNLNGQNGDDSILGDAGNDVITGGAGVDTLAGGLDNDFLSGQTEAGLLSGGDGNDTLQGNTANDTLNGEAGDDRLFGLQSDDVLSGGDGADSLLGGVGNDSLNAGAGADTLQGDVGNDTLDGGADFDRINEVLDTSFTVVGINLSSSGLGVDTVSAIERIQLSGGAGDNLLDARQSSVPVFLSGGAGNDTLLGGSKADGIVGGDGDDVLSGGGGNDVLEGSAGTDYLFEQADTNFTINGVTITSSATGSDTPTTVERIVLIGGISANKLDATLATIPVVLIGGRGNDTLLGGSQSDTLSGGNRNDSTVAGSDGVDSLDGGSGADVLENDSADTLVLGAGDTAIADVFAQLPNWVDAL